MSCETYEVNGYMHDLIIISHELHVPYPTRSGFQEEEEYANNKRLPRANQLSLQAYES